MSEYPENRVYVIMPIEKAFILFGDVVNYCRKSLDEKFIVWKFEANSEILVSIKDDVDIKFYNYNDIFILMFSDNWCPKNFISF